MSLATQQPFLKLSGICRDYPGVKALRDVDFGVSQGEVVGLVGENGAGKSTLMKILGGVVQPTSGTIEIDGETCGGWSVGASMRAGIAFVHQELNLFENLSVAANIFIGREPLRGGPFKLTDNMKLIAQAKPILQSLGADFGADAPVAELSLAQQQLVEIAKAISMKARLVIMDEPTSSLTASETERLLKLIGKLRQDGVAVIYISHRLSEVEKLADRVVVLRDGKFVTELHGAEIKATNMIRHMIGRELKTLYTAPASSGGGAVLQLADVRTALWPQQPVDLSVMRGEILGLAGLMGSGRTELARTIFALDPWRGGEMRLNGKTVRFETPRDAISAGMFLVPEDRKRAGLILDMPIRCNISLANLASFASYGLVKRGVERRVAADQQKKLDIRARGVDIEARLLSGGNQQKVVLAKWLSMQPSVMIFDEPTRGVDVGAKSEIYALMRGLSNRGVGILMISSDMEEVIGVSDRVVVMHEGRIAGELRRDQLSEHAIVSLAVGREAA